MFMKLTKEQIHDLVGSDSFLMILPGSKYQQSREKVYAHIVETQVLNVRINAFYPLLKYWHDYCLGAGIPDDNHVFCILWADITYLLVSRQQPDWLVDRVNTTLKAHYRRLREGELQSQPVATPAPAPVRYRGGRRKEKREVLLLDLPPELC